MCNVVEEETRIALLLKQKLGGRVGVRFMFLYMVKKMECKCLHVEQRVMVTQDHEHATFACMGGVGEGWIHVSSHCKENAMQIFARLTTS